MAGLTVTGTETIEVTIPNNNNNNNSNPRGALDIPIISRFRDRQKFLTLSEEGTKYIEFLKKLNDDSNMKFTFESLKTNNMDSILITHGTGSNGILLGFSEVASKSSENPVIHNLQPIINQVKAKGVNIANTILVGPEDYSKGPNMFQYICDILDVAIDNPSIRMDISEFRGLDILVSTNLSEAEETLRKMYPHAVLPRMDLAATFKLVDPKNRDEVASLAVVTGYTDFIGSAINSGYSNASIPKFSPLFHMEVHSAIADPCLIGLVLPSAVDIFCMNHQWLRVYDTYGPDDLNLGLLIPSPDTLAPWRAVDRNQRDEFIRKYVEPIPNPILDVSAGKAQIPLVKFLSNDRADMDALRQKIANFFKTNLAEIPDVVDINRNDIINFTGIISTDTSGLIDSRKIDYLHIANKSNSVDRAKLFLNYYADPTIRAKALHEFYPAKWENRYITSLKVVSSDFLNAMNVLLARNNVTFIYENRFDSGYNGGLFDPMNNLTNVQNLKIGNLQRTTSASRGFTFHL